MVLPSPPLHPAMIKSLDRFIERSTQLLEARPDTTRISTTYTHRRAKHNVENVSVTGSKPATLTVKTYDPVSGACYRIRIHKSNELSRIMSSLGPRSITLTSGSKSKKIAGMASVMAAVDPIEEDQIPVASTNAGAKSKNKNKKK